MFKKKLLITGSKGLVGSLLANHLGKKYDLILVDKQIQNRNDKRNYHQVDISEIVQVEKEFRSYGDVELAIHLAADPSPESNWESVLRNNITGTWNFYSAMHEFNKVKRVIFASSNHVTGHYESVDGSTEPNLCKNNKGEMISINSKLKPDGPYGISKITGEAIARYYFDRHEIQSVCLRIGSVLKDDIPEKNSRQECTWLSYKDLTRLIDCSLQVEAVLSPGKFSGFGIYYGVSNNEHKFWDIENARKELGYDPKDNASTRTK